MFRTPAQEAAGRFTHSGNCISPLRSEMGSTSLCAAYMETHMQEDRLPPAELLNNWIFRKDGDGLPSALG